MSGPVPQFTIRVLAADASEPEETVPAGPYFDVAVDHAIHLAAQSRVRSAIVTDDGGMEWARFNLLWQVPAGWRGDFRHMGNAPEAMQTGETR